MYCVAKNTTTVIDRNNPEESMIVSAISAGFSESEVEIITEEEYQTRVNAEPKPLRPPTDKERLDDLEAGMAAILGGAV